MPAKEKFVQPLGRVLIGYDFHLGRNNRGYGFHLSHLRENIMVSMLNDSLIVVICMKSSEGCLRVIERSSRMVWLLKLLHARLVMKIGIYSLG